MDIEKLINIKATILVTGESGSGKSYWSTLLARKREHSDSGILTVDLASLSEGLVESEVFGHEKGAFTGAFCKKIGLCEQVGSGTLILDEIGELGLESQKKFLTLLERRVFRPVGSNKEVVFRGKIIAATNRDLVQMVEKGTFREDLYYRLKVFHHHITPLRERSESEKVEIIRQLISLIMKDYRLTSLPVFTSDAKKYLLTCNWRGNIRQLRHSLEYLMVMHQGEDITVDMVVGQLDQEKNSKIDLDNFFHIGHIPYSQIKAEFEKRYLLEALTKTRGMVNQTALLIGMNKSTFINKIRQYEINILEFKNAKKMENVA